MKDFYTIAELVELNLPGMPSTVRGVTKMATRGLWKERECAEGTALARRRSGRGGGLEYHYSLLPSSAQARLVIDTSQRLPANQDNPPRTAGLADWQSATMEARAAILGEVDRRTRSGQTATKAIEQIVAEAKAGELAEDLARLIPIANARSGQGKRTRGGRKLGRTSLFRWYTTRRDQGIKALAPAAGRKATIPAWAGTLMEAYATPTKRSLQAVLEELPGRLPEGVEAPHYDQARRFLKTLSNIDRHKGRMGPRALKSMKAYVARDVSGLWPTAVYVADGHTFDAEVAHPIHSRPFRPELTAAIDVFTRRIVGWSAGLAESTWTVLDAARNAFETSGLCDIWYVDRGKGFNNEAFDGELTGFLARLNITKENSLPYNSQARGVIERVHQSIWVRGAKTLPTFMGADMDPEARQNVFKLTRRDVAEFGQSPHLMAWDAFMAWAQQQVDSYNARPHSGLERIRDVDSGKRRHMTPDEAWQQAIDGGWSPDVVTAAESADLFRPHERRKTRRAMVSLFGNSYFAQELEAFHGDDVLVGYDIHDPTKVWVKTLDGRLICTAEFGGNKASYFPVSAAQQAHERRIQGRLGRVAKKVDEIEAERRPAALIEHEAEETVALSAQEEALAEAALERLSAPDPQPEAGADASERPTFSTDAGWALWLTENSERATAEDRQHLRDKLRHDPFRMMMEWEGIDVALLETLAKKSEAA